MIKLNTENGKGEMILSGTEVDLAADLLLALLEVANTTENREQFLIGFIYTLLPMIKEPFKSESIRIILPGTDRTPSENE